MSARVIISDVLALGMNKPLPVQIPELAPPIQSDQLDSNDDPDPESEILPAPVAQVVPKVTPPALAHLGRGRGNFAYAPADRRFQSLCKLSPLPPGMVDTVNPEDIMEPRSRGAFMPRRPRLRTDEHPVSSERRPEPPATPDPERVRRPTPPPNRKPPHPWVCWNCWSYLHEYPACPERRRTFCRGYGRTARTLANCPRCADEYMRTEGCRGSRDPATIEEDAKISERIWHPA